MLNWKKKIGLKNIKENMLYFKSNYVSKNYFYFSKTYISNIYIIYKYII